MRPAASPSVRAAIAHLDKELSERPEYDDPRWRRVGSHGEALVSGGARRDFAGLALLLAMVGLFGILAHSIQQRVREFWVRRALGATSGDVLRLVVGSAARVIGTGYSPRCCSLQPLDPITFASVTLVLVLTAAASIAAPAWRATRVDPAVALRQD